LIFKPKNGTIEGMVIPTPEQAPSDPSLSPDRRLTVEQPERANLEAILGEIENVTEVAAKRATEDIQKSAGKGGPLGDRSQNPPPPSARDLAIADLPPLQNMQKQLEQHIRTEVRKLRKEAHHITRMNKPGSAYHLNKLYSRIRQLNALLSRLLESSIDILKRFFVRVFIDNQPIL